MKGRGCPFQPKSGYATSDTRLEWMRRNNVTPDDDHPDDMKSLQANPDHDAPLYFWQIYSLIGQRPIISIVRNFYERVFQDTENPWFQNVFENISDIGYHVSAQSAYWIDAFGGGKQYHGGNHRLMFHHECNASKIMNARGATRWMFHMRRALQDHTFDDPRIQPCILDFLKIKMQGYAEDHTWTFDETDFKFPIADDESDIDLSLSQKDEPQAPHEEKKEEMKN
eukprot:scaffold19837_cov46-Attheya_sp.AAC.3